MSLLFLLAMLLATLGFFSAKNDDEYSATIERGGESDRYYEKRGREKREEILSVKGFKLSFEEEGKPTSSSSGAEKNNAREQNLCFFLDERVANTKHPLSHKVAGLMRLFLSSAREEVYGRVTAIVSVGSENENNFNPDAFQRAMFAPSDAAMGSREPLRRGKNVLVTEVLRSSSIDGSDAVKRSHAAFVRLSDKFSERRCDAAHFFNPSLAHFSALARRERVALKDVPIIAHRVDASRTELDAMNKAFSSGSSGSSSSSSSSSSSVVPPHYLLHVGLLLYGGRLETIQGR